MKTKRTKNKMMGKVILCILFAAFSLFATVDSYSQGAAINTTGANADPSAMIDISSTVSGALIPRMTEAQRNAIVNPAYGLQVINTTSNCLNIWLGSTWKQLCGDCDFTPPVVGNNGPICAGSTLNLTATSILGATYQWTGPNNFSSTDQNPVISNASAGASGTYSVTATKNGCTSQPQSMVATVNAAPSPTQPGTITGSTVNLGNQTGVTYSISPVNFATTYNWTVPTGVTITGGQGSTSIIVTFSCSGSGNIAVIANNACGISPQQTLGVSTSLATPGIISGPTPVDRNSTGNVYSIAPVPFATSYNWTVPAGASITANTGTSITVAFGNSSLTDNITVSATSPCGTGGQSTLSISIGMQTFSCTGSSQTFTVPSGSTSVIVQAYGAQGGNNGGLGGSAIGTVTVTSGQTIYVYVGCVGVNPTGGFNGGGNGATTSWGGGGASDVRIGGIALSNRVIVAGGGGGKCADGTTTYAGCGGCGTAGTSGSDQYAGGSGGNGWSGGNGSNGGLSGGAGGSNSVGAGGGGGGYNSGGSGGCASTYCGTLGTLGQGGNGNFTTGFCTNASGGGGGGYYGGGGGTSGNCGGGSGGGGSSAIIGGITNVSFSGGVQSGNGKVVIIY